MTTCSLSHCGNVETLFCLFQNSLSFSWIRAYFSLFSPHNKTNWIYKLTVIKIFLLVSQTHTNAVSFCWKQQTRPHRFESFLITANLNIFSYSVLTCPYFYSIVCPTPCGVHWIGAWRTESGACKNYENVPKLKHKLTEISNCLFTFKICWNCSVSSNYAVQMS
jgi:hypothetical protein